MYVWTAVVTIAAMVMYFVLTLNVGRARMKYGVKPPAMTGDVNFECAVRVQQNTLEQLIFFLPILWICSVYFNSIVAAALGGTWVIGRILYAWGYYQAPEKRFPGFALSMLSALGLLVGSGVGLIQTLLV